MATRIRLTRTGKKNKPSFRVVVADALAPRDGKFIEILGYYNPSLPSPEFKIDEQRYQHWLKAGAQPTTAIKKLLEGTYVYIPYEANKKSVNDETVSEQAEPVAETATPTPPETEEPPDAETA